MAEFGEQPFQLDAVITGDAERPGDLAFADLGTILAQARVADERDDLIL
jgi:hypothetical protein